MTQQGGQFAPNGVVDFVFEEQRMATDRLTVNSRITDKNQLCSHHCVHGW